MDRIELLVVTAAPGLLEELQQYEGLQPFNISLTRARAMIASEQPPGAIYLEDTRDTLPELWEIIRAAQARRIPVLLGLRSVGLAHRADFMDAGLPVTDAREITHIAAWIGQQLGVRPRAARNGQRLIAVAGAKGGIGKTLVVAMLAEGFHRRGLRVLVVDGDLSNSGIVPAYRIPSGFPSYLYIKNEGIGGFTVETVRRHIYHHTVSGIDFLLGSEETADAQDLNLSEWQALMQAVRALDSYDIIILDTGPEIKKRPYALDAARHGGLVVLPTPPGRKERVGAGNALKVFQEHTPDLTDLCRIIYMAPEKGVVVKIKDIAPRFAGIWPKAKAIGTIPRDPYHVSRADEEGDRYLSPLDIAPHSTFSRSIHEIVEVLCRDMSVTPPLPMPRSSWWQRLQAWWRQSWNRQSLQPAAATSAGALEMQEHQ